MLAKAQGGGCASREFSDLYSTFKNSFPQFAQHKSAEASTARCGAAGSSTAGFTGVTDD